MESKRTLFREESSKEDPLNHRDAGRNQVIENLNSATNNAALNFSVTPICSQYPRDIRLVGGSNDGVEMNEIGSPPFGFKFGRTEVPIDWVLTE